MTVLESVDASLKSFRPKNHRQFIVYNIARHFDDIPNLARYLTIAEAHPKRMLLEAARLAQRRFAEEGGSLAEHFFDLLEGWQKERFQ
jgi:hypothetical protein